MFEKPKRFPTIVNSLAIGMKAKSTICFKDSTSLA
jgi:hypothetical protein